MQISDEQLTQMRIAHLQMIQDIITRMANYSAAVKNYTVAIGAALLALYSSESGGLESLLFAVVPFLAFMVLDARYLGLERSFREFYDTVRARPLNDPAHFDILPTKSSLTTKLFFSWSVAWFYLPLILIFLSIYYSRSA